MKKIFFLVGLLLFANQVVVGQGLKDKLKEAKEQLFGKGKKENAEKVAATKSDEPYQAADQLTEFEKYRASDRVYKITQRTSGSFYHDKFNSEYEPMDKFIAEKYNKELFRHAIADYTPHSSHAPLYYTNKSQSEQIIFSNGTMFHVTGLKEDGSFYKLVSIHTTDKNLVRACAKWDADYAKNAVASYIKAVKPIHDAAENNATAEKEKAAAEKRTQYTITNKDVKSINLSVAKKMEQGEIYGLMVVATLKDGSTISTKEGGYMDEYEITVSGIPATYNDPTSISGKRATVGESSIQIPDLAAVSGDKVLITVKAKHNAALKVSQEAVMDYSKSVDLNYNAEMRSDKRSIVGGDMRIELKQLKHAVTSEDLLEYKVFNGKGELLKHFRINQSASVNVSVNGQKGWKAISATKPPMNGTKGGDVKIIIDPSVGSYNLNISNTGGRGGDGGYGYPAGSDGRDGKVEKVKQKVTW